MAIQRRDRIFPHFWFVKEAEEAGRFYASIFPDSRVDRVFPIPVDTPGGPAGSVKIVDFTLFGQRFQAISAGPLDPFNHAISMVVVCDDQAEVDRYWAALLEGGGVEERCGWLRDRYGVSWQIVPRIMDDMLADTDLPRARQVAYAMEKMVKLDIAKLRAAYERR